MTQRDRAILAIAEAGYWLLAYELQPYTFHGPRHAFDMHAFTPEARDHCNDAQGRLFDLCVQWTQIPEDED